MEPDGDEKMNVLEITKGVVPVDSDQRPYLDVCIYLNEDGTFSGDVFSERGSRRIPSDSRIDRPERFFAIPENLISCKTYLRATDFPGEMIVTLRDEQFCVVCSFRRERLPADCAMNTAVAELIGLVDRITSPDFQRPALTSAEECAKRKARPFALHDAAVSGDLVLMDEIFAMRPEQISVENGNGFTPLEQAMWTGGFEAAKRLIEFGSDLNVRDSKGQTPLHIACVSGEVEKVALLVEHGAHIDAATNEGWRPIHFAVMSNRTAVVRYLKEKGAIFDSNDPVMTEAKRISKTWKGHL